MQNTIIQFRLSSEKNLVHFFLFFFGSDAVHVSLSIIIRDCTHVAIVVGLHDLRLFVSDEQSIPLLKP